MEQLKKSGLTNAIGVSNFNTQLLSDMLTYCDVKPAVCQTALFPKRAQTDLLRFLNDHGVQPCGYSPVGRPNDERGSANIIDDSLILGLAEKYGRSPVQIVLNWGLCRGYPIIPLTSQLKNQKANMEVVNFQLDSEEVQAITDKFDCNQLLFQAPEECDYNLFA